MYDNFFAFVAQLIVTEPERYLRVRRAQALGVFFILIIASGVGSLLAPLPLRWLGLLALAPLGFAVRSWQRRSTPREHYRRGAFTTFAITMALGGDNVAVWTPLFRSNNFLHGFLTAGVFALWEIIFLVGSQNLASHPRVAKWGVNHTPALMPFIYVGLAVLIVIECKVF
jgi:cadmium resistance protein CadD (predicted permease)